MSESKGLFFIFMVALITLITGLYWFRDREAEKDGGVDIRDWTPPQPKSPWDKMREDQERNGIYQQPPPPSTESPTFTYPITAPADTPTPVYTPPEPEPEPIYTPPTIKPLPLSPVPPPPIIPLPNAPIPPPPITPLPNAPVSSEEKLKAM